MISRRHKVFNMLMILVPWLSLLFIGKQNFKRYAPAGIFIIIFEIINHKYGQKRKFWTFFDKRKSFLTNELPFSVGPYMPLSMWLLKFSYGNLKKFLLLNAISDGIFAFWFINFLEKVKIIRLNRLSNFQFFWYLYYKAFLLYGVQKLVENKRTHNSI
jgi:hypothetical protein